MKILTKNSLLALIFAFNTFVVAQETLDPSTTEVITVEGTQTTQSYPKVLLQTNVGEIELELYPDKAPISVQNFLSYVNDGFYDGLIFHRVVYNFVIQSGGFDADLNPKQAKNAIKSESDNGLNNDRGTLAMARMSDPNSATSQFYINVRDNNGLDYGPRKVTKLLQKTRVEIYPGYTVFGKVTKGMEIVDKIAQSDVVRRAEMRDVPRDNVLILKATQLNKD